MAAQDLCRGIHLIRRNRRDCRQARCRIGNCRWEQELRGGRLSAMKSTALLDKHEGRKGRAMAISRPLPQTGGSVRHCPRLSKIVRDFPLKCKEGNMLL